ncbi:hypothetical protein P691DRAFT_720537 [Macrolepiota fuliginosa MF-IS2]|uniref:Uncharacterized protein n=1 Tax=Macrolepiota fuliginosa MF-IS2 TaxID=1400762 RepID=A0A9P5XKE6_9AGAR|nr:hypothetical protein P691DRAFT_720537 [Macrolepiota fuliginosa MF-IS2]
MSSPKLELDEDAIDLQDIQAQINLSMSFAQNLVTSWVKPTHFKQTNRQRHLENELKEYMRRPTRLGVGAPIPETQGLAREAAKLKARLEGGKKRQRGDDVKMRELQSEGEEESRGGAIRKKARIDPFDVGLKKKKVAEVNGKNPVTIHPMALKAISQIKLDKALGDEPDADDSTNGLLSAMDLPETHKRKKKHKSESGTNEGPRRELVARVERMVDSIDSSQISPNITEHLKTPPHSFPLMQPSSASTATYPKIVDVSLTATPLLSPGHRTTTPDFLKQPLLNLDGSPNEGASNKDRKPDPADLTPKKRRKRRKKKKSQSNTASALTDGQDHSEFD